MNEQRVVEIQYSTITLEEAVYMLQTHDGESWLDADKQALVMVE